MKSKYLILVGLIAIGLFALPIVIQAEQYGDVVCTERFVPSHMYSCKYPDGKLRGFFTYDQMNAYYVPPDTETFIPEVTYVYATGAGTNTMTAQT